MKSFAHGRVNLIGEHTDYNNGFVLPTLIPQRTSVEVRLRDDDEVHVQSSSLGSFDYRLGSEKRSNHWCDYVMGLTQVLVNYGLPMKGVDLQIASDVPIGSGLSSSAALILAVIRSLRELFQWDLTDLEAAPLAQRVENDFVGARVGIMDPLACALALPDHALFVDTRNLQTELIPLPQEASLLVIHSGVSHRNVGGGYNERRAQCEEAAQKLSVKSLRDLSIEKLSEYQKKLPEMLFRRVRHVVTENTRVLHCVQALKTNDLERVGELFSASHASLRDDYQVSIPEIDQLVECVQHQAGVFGARLTGGGFGGSIVALVRNDKIHAVGKPACMEYSKATGQKPVILIPQS